MSQLGSPSIKPQAYAAEVAHYLQSYQGVKPSGPPPPSGDYYYYFLFILVLFECAYYSNLSIFILLFDYYLLVLTFVLIITVFGKYLDGYL